MMLASLLVLCVLVTSLVLAIWLRGSRQRNMLRHLPAYPQLPILGNMLRVMGSTEHLLKFFNKIAQTMDCNNMPFLLWIGPQPVLLINDPEDIKAVTNTFLDKPYYYAFAKEWMGDGLVTAPGNIWKRSIKQLSGTLSGNVVDGYLDIFNMEAAKLTAKLKRDVGREPFDMLHDYLAYTTMESICRTALGHNGSENFVTADYYDAFSRCLELLITRGLNLLLHFDFIYQFTPAYKEFKKCIAVINNVSETIIRNRKKQRDEMKKKGMPIVKSRNPDQDKESFQSIVDILLNVSEMDPTLTDEKIKTEINTIIVAGQETVAITLCYNIIMLGKRPDVQQKLYTEMKEIFGNSKRAVTKEDLVKMKFCEAVLHETMRLYPAVPFVLRNADKDLALSSCTVPKGTICGIHSWAAGRSQRAWGADAEEYRPERWMSDSPPSGYPGSFLPFSAGKRSCVGKKYALMIMKTVLAYIVREIEIVSEKEELKLKLDLGLKPVSGHLVQVRLRE